MVRRRAIAIACMAIGVACLAGCSSDSSGTSASDISSRTPQSDCGAEAQAAYEKAVEAPKFDLPPAFDASEVKGKTFAYVGIITNSIIQEKFDAFAEGLKSVGAKAIYFDGKGRPDVITQAIESAIAQNVSAIIGDGIDAAALAGSAVAHANAANIPVINMNAGDPGSSLPEGIAANVAPGAFKTGVLQADYLLAKTDCQTNALSVFTSAAKLLADQNTAFKKEVERLCPTDCKVTEVDFDAATYPTSMTPQMQSALQRDPSVNAIALGDVTAPYIATAVQSVNSEAIMIGAQGDALVDALKGAGVAADVVWPPTEVLGYYGADAVMRAALDQPLTVETPLRLVDSSNWGTDPSIAAQFPGSENLPDEFKKVWGVQ